MECIAVLRERTINVIKGSIAITVYASLAWRNTVLTPPTVQVPSNVSTTCVILWAQKRR